MCGIPGRKMRTLKICIHTFSNSARMFIGRQHMRQFGAEILMLSTYIHVEISHFYMSPNISIEIYRTSGGTCLPRVIGSLEERGCPVM